MNSSSGVARSDGNSMLLPTVLVLMIMVAASGMGWAFWGAGFDLGLLVAMVGMIAAMAVAWLNNGSLR